MYLRRKLIGDFKFLKFDEQSRLLNSGILFRMMLGIKNFNATSSGNLACNYYTKY